jgi:threonine dehydrogenase-like Zn-dependent dehydrogenase
MSETPMSALAEPLSPPGLVRAGTMRAAVVAAPGRIDVRDVAVPEPGAGEVRVRLEGCGVCASNLPPWEGRPWFQYPLAPGELGHEGWGRIDAVGPAVYGWSVGERVALLSYRAYAEYDVAPVSALLRLPPELDDAPFPGEPLGCAMNIFARSGIQPGQTVAIVGIGFLGALLTGLAAHAGARVLAIARRSFALEIAKARGAAETLVMDDHQRIIEAVRGLTNGSFCDVVIEAVGKQWPLDLAGELTRERGRLVIAGYHQDGPRQVNLQLWNWRGLDVINAHERDPAIYLAGMNAAREALAGGALDPLPLYTHRFPLEQLADALAITASRPDGFMKALVTM